MEEEVDKEEEVEEVVEVEEVEMEEEEDGEDDMEGRRTTGGRGGRGKRKERRGSDLHLIFAVASSCTALVIQSPANGLVFASLLYFSPGLTT